MRDRPRVRVRVSKTSLSFPRSEVRQPRKHPFALGGIVPVVGLQSNGKTIREVVVFGVLFVRLERWTLKNKPFVFRGARFATPLYTHV